MNAETFLEQFDTFAEVPNGVDQLRAMILQLAVQGQLVSQDPSDEPACEILHRACSVSDATTSKAKRANSAEDTSNPVESPKGWVWTTLGELGVVSPRNKMPDETEVSFVPMASISTQYNAPLQPEVRKWSDVKQGFTHLADGDVAMAKITPCFQNCKTTVMRDLTNGFGAGTTELHILRPYPKCLIPEYAVIFLRSPQFVEEGVSRMSGSAGQQRVPKEHFAESPFPLPPLAEQKRIVAKVDQLLALCDALAARQAARRVARAQLVGATLDRLVSTPWDRLPACQSDSTPRSAGSRVVAPPRQAGSLSHAPHVDRLRTHFDHLFDTPTTIPQLRQTILQLAVQGQLVPQDPTDEPASVLYERIQIERGGATTNADSDDDSVSVEPSKSEPLTTYPSSWKVVSFVEILVYGPRNGTSPKPVDRITKTKSLTLSATTSGRFDGRHVKYLEEVVSPDSYLWLREGDILIQRSNSENYVGVAAVYHGEPNQFVYPDLMMKVRVTPSVEIEFAHLVLKSPPTRTYFRTLATGTSGSMRKINKSTVQQLAFPLPPLAEQKRIVAKVTELLSLCDALEAQLKTAESASTELLSAAVHHLLTGTK